jgi:hypothetical protein
MSNIERLAMLGLGFAFTAAAVKGDEVLFERDSKLSGRVTAIAPDGTVSLESSLAAEPVAIKPGSIRRVLFESPKEAAVLDTSRLKLTDGSILPCEPMSLDDSQLVVSTRFAGSLSVPRGLIASLELGIHEQKPVYEDRGILTGWINQNWDEMDGGGFTVEGSGKLARTIELPDQYSIQYDLAWRGMPSLQTSFADATSEAPNKQNRYFLQFNAAGFELRRFNADGNRQVALFQVPRQPDSFVNSKCSVEIRVDRTRSEIWFYLDGVLEGHQIDSGENPPSGNGISFNAMAGNDTTHTLTRFRVMTWDAAGDRHRTEERGDPKSDALIDAEGDRYSGRLESITNGEGKVMLSFRSPLLENPMKIPARNVSTVFFEKKEEEAPAFAPGELPFQVRLLGGGMVRLSACNFTEGAMVGRHPGLGDVSIKRDAILSMEGGLRVPEPKAAEVEPSETEPEED